MQDLPGRTHRVCGPALQPPVHLPGLREEDWHLPDMQEEGQHHYSHLHLLDDEVLTNLSNIHDISFLRQTFCCQPFFKLMFKTSTL